jgi:hypothetical protein
MPYTKYVEREREGDREKEGERERRGGDKKERRRERI